MREVIEVLREVPEYEWATRNNAGPRIFVGEKERKAGKVVVDMTGGTTGPKEGIEKMVEAGVGTMVSMHMPKEHIEEVLMMTPSPFSAKYRQKIWVGSSVPL